MAFPNHFAAATAETHKRLREIREMQSIAGQAVDRLVQTAFSYPADAHEAYFTANGENYRIRIERIPNMKGKTVLPHQQRVVEEKQELDEKANKLSQFIGTNPVFETLPVDEQGRLREQCELMWQYSEILGQRIAAFQLT